MSYYISYIFVGQGGGDIIYPDLVLIIDDNSFPVNNWINENLSVKNI